MKNVAMFKMGTAIYAIEVIKTERSKLAQETAGVRWTISYAVNITLKHCSYLCHIGLPKIHALK